MNGHGSRSSSRRGNSRGGGSAPKDPARPFARSVSVQPGCPAVHYDHLDPAGRAGRIDEIADIVDALRVEQDEIGVRAIPQHSAIREAEPFCRQTGHAAHGLFQREQPE